MIDKIKQHIQPQVTQLLDHSLYAQIKTPEQLQIFMEHHVYAVWDFMSLLKSLQQHLTQTKSPWFPIGNPETRYLINEIVLAEETDVNFYGKRQSHYEMYIDAMQKAGASTIKINSFLNQVIHGTDIYLIIATSELPWSIKQFVKFTFELIYEGKPHKIAAAFTFGREGLIPGMFSSIIKNIQQNFPEKDLQLFKYYFDRHIELDDDKHGPMAFEMITHLCGNNSEKWRDVQKIATKALEARIKLWNGIEEEVQKTAS
ncbi:DUF3050 domain-containing protein [Zunongwangia sp.]|uniref:DUF3050 domain-containing protein n=1 Tax=Zunongwangia sp. TaxID=1965325 RepID=UPI003AA92243